jgi:hypothetical protein
MDNTYKINASAKSKIINLLQEDTKLVLHIPTDLQQLQRIVFEQQNTEELGLFGTFLETAELVLSYYADANLNMLQIDYDCRIKYKSGGSNGFGKKYRFYLETGDLLAIYY